MPTSAPRRCRGCRQLVRGRCQTCNPSWVRTPSSWAGGSSRAWRAFRADWLNQHPMCMEPGCEELATVVCHVEGTDYAVDRFNPDAIEGQRCAEHDAMVTARQGGAARRRGA